MHGVLHKSVHTLTLILNIFFSDSVGGHFAITVTASNFSEKPSFWLKMKVCPSGKWEKLVKGETVKPSICSYSIALYFSMIEPSNFCL